MYKRVELIKESIRGKTLDVGCNDGVLHNELLKTGKEIIGLDNNVSRIIKGNAENLSRYTKEKFDTVVAGELIEHLEYPKDFIKEAHKVLKENGRLIITTPNRDAWINSLNLFLGKHYFEHQGHISVMSLERLKRLLKENGFILEKFAFLPYDYDSLGRGDGYVHLVWFRKIMHNLIPDRLKEDMIIIARKRI